MAIAESSKEVGYGEETVQPPNLSHSNSANSFRNVVTGHLLVKYKWIFIDWLLRYHFCTRLSKKRSLFSGPRVAPTFGVEDGCATVYDRYIVLGWQRPSKSVK
jgi:hypothetical protein